MTQSKQGSRVGGYEVMEMLSGTFPRCCFWPEPRSGYLLIVHLLVDGIKMQIFALMNGIWPLRLVE